MFCRDSVAEAVRFRSDPAPDKGEKVAFGNYFKFVTVLKKKA